MHTHPATVVVGGGIAGVMATVSLAEAGIPALLLERNPLSLGGRVSLWPPTSFEMNGETWSFTTEHGVHGWWRQYRNFLAILAEHGLEGRMIDAWDQALLFHDGRQFYRTNVGREPQVTPVPEPLHHAQLLLHKNIRRLIRTNEIPKLAAIWVRLMETIRFDPYSGDHLARYDRLTVNDYAQGVPFYYAAFLRSLSRSAFFSDPEDVSLFTGMMALQLYVFLRKSDQAFAFCRGPIVPRLVEPLVQVARDRGARTALGVRVDRLLRGPTGGWRLHLSPEDGQDRLPGELADAPVLDASEVILAVDVEGAKALLRTSPDLAPALAGIDVLAGRPATSVRLWFARSPTEAFGESGVFTGKTVADNYFWLHRFQDEFLDFHVRSGGSAIECHVYAPPWKHDLSDEETLRRVREDVEGAFPEVAGSCVHGQVIRNKATHINFPVGCARAFPRVETPHRDLFLAGDWIDGGQPYLYMERACHTGLAAANGIRALRGRPPRPLLAPTPPPAHIGALQRGLRALDRRFPDLWGTRGPTG